MARYVVECSTGFVGCSEMVVVEANSESEAEDIALEWWDDMVASSVTVDHEIEEGDTDHEGYEEIN